MLIYHRINTIEDLNKVPSEYGIEVDLRDCNNNIHLSHDPFEMGEMFESFLDYFNHKFLILNIKSERIELRVLEILKKRNISNFFFLDSSFPMIINLSSNGCKKISARFSEYEEIQTILNIKDRIEWVWVDCFSKFPLTKNIFDKLKENNLKICIVSPELQGQQDKLLSYKKYMIDNKIKPDMICTKSYNIELWKEIFN